MIMTDHELGLPTMAELQQMEHEDYENGKARLRAANITHQDFEYAHEAAFGKTPDNAVGCHWYDYCKLNAGRQDIVKIDYYINVLAEGGSDDID